MAKNEDKKLPSRKKLEEVRKKLSDPSVLGSSLLPENASVVDRTKYKACEMIIRFRHQSNLKQKELADRLVNYAQILYPNLKLNLIAA